MATTDVYNLVGDNINEYFAKWVMSTPLKCICGTLIGYINSTTCIDEKAFTIIKAFSWSDGFCGGFYGCLCLHFKWMVSLLLKLQHYKKYERINADYQTILNNIKSIRVDDFGLTNQEINNLEEIRFLAVKIDN